MRDLFPGYYRPSEEEFKTLWENCTFVFDTNVLLDLYRYPEKAREEFLSVLESKGIFHRFWLPHQAALEFQRNRLKVAWDSLIPLDELKKDIDTLERKANEIGVTIDKGSTRGIFGVIKKEPFQSNLAKEIIGLKKAVDDLKSSREDEIEKEYLRKEIDKLINGKIGPPPQDQQELDAIYADGEKRYSHNMPPGYLDQDKEPAEIMWSNLSYRRKFGDLILWKQIIKHVKEKDLNYLIFVTNDIKTDWWWIEEYQGKKTFGPRPELVEEVKRETNLKIFYMYNVERFLENAKKHLRIKFDDSHLKQIKEVSKSKEEAQNPFSVTAIWDAILEFLENQFPGAEIEICDPNLPGPDVVATTSTGNRIGFEIKTITSLASARNLESLMNRIKKYRIDFNLHDLRILFIIFSFEHKISPLINMAEKLILNGFDGVYIAILISDPDKDHLKILFETE